MNFDRIQNFDYCVEKAIEHNKSFKSCHVAFLIRSNKIISYGYNRMDRNCYNGKFVTSVHAEVDCLRKYVKNLNKCKFIVIKIDRTCDSFRIYRDSRPCDCCTKFIDNKGIKNFYASTEDGCIKKFFLNTYEPFKIQPKIF